MLLSGYSYDLPVVRISSEGAWLDAAGEELLLPQREVPAGLTTGATINVFLYYDRRQRLLATLTPPVAQVGEFALLQVKSRGAKGAFLNWGLEKDLFVPDQEQAEPMLVGRSYLVRICHDRENRPMASSRLDKFLLQDNRDLQPGDRVNLQIWMFTDLGAKVIVNHLYSALLYRDDLLPGLKRGDQLSGYVSRIRDDGKIDVTLQPPGAAGIEAARAVLLEHLRRQGFLPLTDQSPPEVIRSQLGLSKKLFKKALGGLYKEGKVVLEQDGIRLLTD
ncbi:MAG: S1-like domain-containing RNA-binding protein [Pelovirga sp.]